MQAILWLVLPICWIFPLSLSSALALCQDELTEPSSQISNSIEMTLVLIPEGRFTMGSPASESGSKEDETVHKVELTKSFFMATTEVTEHQWAVVMEPATRMVVEEERDPKTNRLIRKVEKQIANPNLGSQNAKAKVTWEEAVEFCKRLGELPEEKKEGRKYRLPTEAEWEYACRAGSATAYSFGDDPSDLKRYCTFGQSHWGGPRTPLIVGQKLPNAWGLYDMHGNVCEWCSDWYGSYPEGIVADPQGPFSGKFKVSRGGGWGANAEACRSAKRDKHPSPSKNGGNGQGFRPVLDIR
jgi:formylglycine-generating enzyme required for sulfatase activity